MHFLFRLEVRLPDTSTNPYLLLASLLAGSLDGLEQEKDVDPSKHIPQDLWEAETPEGLAKLPRTLDRAVEELQKDTKLRESLGEELMEAFIIRKQIHWEDSLNEVTNFELELLDNY